MLNICNALKNDNKGVLFCGLFCPFHIINLLKLVKTTRKEAKTERFNALGMLNLKQNGMDKCKSTDFKNCFVIAIHSAQKKPADSKVFVHIKVLSGCNKGLVLHKLLIDRALKLEV